jgi:hypothetical protein
VLSALHSFIPFVVAYYALMWHTWLPLLAYALLAVAAPFLLLPVLPLRAIQPTEAKRRYLRHAMGMLALVSAFLVCGLLGAYSR